ncbi:hypothetical protein AKJ37_05160 [candidate division MSBL1 archaeon SCGC-AAA259I09]|uniref:Uncharacterized protein n=1 Tax=candidate division MSBL1 archaeon SCGC-AAA259I09 TaxID=1698267 RepID=A0A133UQD7_9EURY|nr:hypothetical protein AKJ37_05160 [candidate division MSBL1 archaeon SCGC-AAA259I09]
MFLLPRHFDVLCCGCRFCHLGADGEPEVVVHSKNRVTLHVFQPERASDVQLPEIVRLVPFKPLVLVLTSVRTPVQTEYFFERNDLLILFEKSIGFGCRRDERDDSAALF